MQLIEFSVEGQTPSPPRHIGSQADASHAFQSRVQRATCESGHEGVQLQVSPDESVWLACENCAIALAEHHVEVGAPGGARP